MSVSGILYFKLILDICDADNHGSWNQRFGLMFCFILEKLLLNVCLICM